jgi:hypothetical protein
MDNMGIYIITDGDLNACIGKKPIAHVMKIN